MPCCRTEALAGDNHTNAGVGCRCYRPPWLFEESYHIVGDLAETIALLIPQSTPEDPPSLAECIAEIMALKQQPEAAKKAYILKAVAAT